MLQTGCARGASLVRGDTFMKRRVAPRGVMGGGAVRGLSRGAHAPLPSALPSLLSMLDAKAYQGYA